MIERVVENWLTSANERQYQIPFCQLLSAEGETILHISTHGQMEQGKDVISRARDRSIHAYQLKGGRLTLADWRKYKPEVDELVVYPIDHPSIRSRKHHKPFLVTNGSVADTVINSIRSANKAWSRMGAKPLILIAGDELLHRFVQAHGKFLPRDPKEFTKFLELVVDAGPSQLDKRKFSSFLESILFTEPSGHTIPRDVQRSVASAVLLTTYIIQGFQRAENHWAVFEAWTVMASYIAAIADRTGTQESWWGTSFDLCILGASGALYDLATECSRNQTKFTQGDPFTDGHFYRFRLTILAGLLSAGELSHQIRKLAWPHRDFVRKFLFDYLPSVQVWGESAVPYLLLAALATERRGNHTQAEGLALQLIHSIAEVNGSKGRGLPNLYYEPEAAIRIISNIDDLNPEVFAGHSYAAEPLVQYLARRLLRKHLSILWEKITHVHFARFAAQDQWEEFKWRAGSGVLLTTMPNAPQSWKDLLKVSQSPPTKVPRAFRRKQEFALYFALVYPHRFSTDLLKIIETAIDAGWINQ